VRARRVRLLTDLAWMELHVEALFVHDVHGRLVRCNEPEGLAAPRFHLGRTAHGNLWRMRDDVERDVRLRLSRLAGRERGLSLAGAGTRLGVAPAERAAAFEKCLAEQAEVVQAWRGPALRFPAQIAPESLSADASLVSIENESDLAATARHFTWLDKAQLEGRQPCVAVVVEGDAVSLCHVARGNPHVAVEAGLDTASPFRGRGFGPHAAAAWAAAVRDIGGEPLYSTSWDNASSRAVARKLGLVLYGEDFHLT